MNDRVRLELLYAFSSLTSFFSIVSNTKSKIIKADRANVISTWCRHRVILADPMFANMISDGSGASSIMIELLDPPKHYPTRKPSLCRK